MTASGTSERVQFDSAGTTLTGHLRGGADRSRRPAVLFCPGFGGTQDTPAVVAAAERFAAAGLVTLTFDYRTFGLSAGSPRQVVSVLGQLEDIRSAIAFLRSRPEVDGDRVALWGSSLGGGHVLTVAAADPRLAAVIAQVPFNGFPPDAGGRPWKQRLALLAAMIDDRVRGWMRRTPRYIPMVGAADELVVMAGDDAVRTVEAMRSQTWENRVAAGGLLDMMSYRPGRTVSQIRAPLLICLAEHDRETVSSTTSDLASQAPHGRLVTYPLSHFEIYHPDHREQVITDQLAFLDDVVAGR